MRDVYKALHRLDPQLLLVYTPPHERWVLYRWPERFGSPPRRPSWSDCLALAAIGRLIPIMTLEDPTSGVPRDPGFWVVDLLRQRDRWRGRWQDLARAIDDANERSRRAAEAAASDRLAYRITEDWARIRDELRGDPRTTYNILVP